MTTSELTYLILLDFENYCIIIFGSCLLLTGPRIAEGKNWERRERM